MHLPKKWFGVPAFGVSVSDEGSGWPCAQGCGAVHWWLLVPDGRVVLPSPLHLWTLPLIPQLRVRTRPPPEALRGPPGEVGVPGLSPPLGPLLALDVRGSQSVSANHLARRSAAENNFRTNADVTAPFTASTFALMVQSSGEHRCCRQTPPLTEPPN